MSRDMKPRKSQPARKKAAGGTLIGMFIGLVLGIAVAAGVVFYLNKSPLPFSKQVQTQAAQFVAQGVEGIEFVRGAGSEQEVEAVALWMANALVEAALREAEG